MPEKIISTSFPILSGVVMSSVATAPKELLTKGVSYISAAVIHPELSELQDRVDSLTLTVNSLRLEIADLKAELQKVKRFPTTEVLPLPPEEIQEAVALYLKKRGEAYPSEIADLLGISVKEVLAVISLLKEQGKVAEV